MLPRVVLILVLLLVFTLVVGAEQPIAERRTIPVSVLDEDGNFVEGLTAHDFWGEFRGQPVKIRTVLQAEPKCIVVLVDASRGVRLIPPTWELAWAATKDFLHALKPPTKGFIITFSDKILLHQAIPLGLAGTSEKFLKAVQADAAKHGNPTRLYDAINAAAEVDCEGSPDILYVISDGVDTTSATRSDAVKATLTERGIRAFFFPLGPDPAEDPRALRRARRQIREIREACGGIVFDFSKKDFSLASNRPSYNSILQSYRLEVELLRAVDKPRRWKLEVVDERGERRKDVQFAYPRLLVPLADSEPQQ